VSFGESPLPLCINTVAVFLSTIKMSQHPVPDDWEEAEEALDRLQIKDPPIESDLAG